MKKFIPVGMVLSLGLIGAIYAESKPLSPQTLDVNEAQAACTKATGNEFRASVHMDPRTGEYVCQNRNDDRKEVARWPAADLG